MFMLYLIGSLYPIAAMVAWFHIVFTGRSSPGTHNVLSYGLGLPVASHRLLPADDRDPAADLRARAARRRLSMADGVVKGEGWAAAPDLDAMGEGYGFRKLRRELEVSEFGVNLITIPPGYSTGGHYHERQQELYFVHRGAIEMTFGDGAKAELREGGTARVDAATVRSVRNLSETEDAQYLIVGAEAGYVGRDAHVPEGETNPRGPGF